MYWTILFLVMIITEYMVSAAQWLVSIPDETAVGSSIIDTDCVIHFTTNLTLVHKVVKQAMKLLSVPG